MSDTSRKHPDQQQLVDFGHGKLGPDQTSEIEEHLDHCAECNDTLLNLADDTFTGLVRSLPEPDDALVVEVPGGKSPADTEHDTGVDRLRVEKELADGAVVADKPSHAATMLVQPGAPIAVSELPTELQDHPRYQIIDQIGQGGMGSVYRAQHRLMNRPVALKLINSQLVRHPQAVERFRREVQAAAQLAHPNIVAAYDAEQAGDVHFLAMEFVEGTDLAAVLSRRVQLPFNEACDYIRQAALGLQHAHEKGMVHRDIKPHNLMLSPDGQVRILDFGLAGFATESAIIESDSRGGTEGETTPLHLTTFGSVMGTPDYLAPEQARDAHSADIRADIYSLGCTLHFVLTGKPPFEADSVVDKLKAHAEAERPELSEVRDDIPPELQSILDRMLAKEPDDRFQTPVEVATALESVAADIQIATSAPNDRQAGISSPRRRPVVLTTTAALFLTAVAAVVFYIVTNNGVVRVEVTDPSLQVTISGQTITMENDDRPLTIRAGDQKLIVHQDGSDFQLVTDSFQLRRGDQVVLKVELLPGKVIVSKDGRRFGSKPLVPKTRDDPTDFYHALNEARLAEFVRKIAEDEKDGTVVGGWTANPPYSIRETSWIDDIDTRIIVHVYARLSELAGDHGLTIEGSQQRELELKSFKYSTAVREGEVVLTLASRDADGLPLVKARRVTLSVEVNEWPKGERPRKNEFRVVIYARTDSEIVEISGPGIRMAGDLTLVTKELLPLIAKYTEPVVVLAAGRGERATTDEPAPLLESVQKMLVAAGAVVKLDPRLSSTTIAVMERPNARANRRTARLNLLRQVGIGLLNYHDYKDSFPPAKQNADDFDDEGRPHLSWRVHILPYINQEELYDRFRLDEPWDSEHNRTLLDQVPDIYRTTDAPTKTTVLAVVGEGTAYEGRSGLKMFEFDRGDGRKRTAYVVDAGRERAVPWTKPEDLSFDKDDPIRAVGTSDFGDELLVLMVDASVQSIPYDTAPESLRALFTRAAGDTFDETAKRTTPLPDPRTAFTLPTLPEPKQDDDPATQQKKQAALTAAQAWLKLVDAGEYGDAWEACAELTRKADDRQTLVTAYTRLFQSTGKLESRKLLTNKYTEEEGQEFVNIQYDTQFTRTRVTETVALIREKDKKWRVSGYFYIPRTPLTPPPWQPEYGKGPIKAGVNLINDPSLEGTAIGERFPKTWGNGNLIPKDAWKFEVVEGGRTGKRSWRIEGDGSAATVPTNRPPVDRGFRYAARAWVKVEAGMARLGLLYFDKNYRYIDGRSSSTTTISRSWHQLTMIDDFENHPNAAYVSLAFVMVGPGKAVFDDVELLAFDADNLPEDFEAEYASPKHDPGLFDCWVGHWELAAEFKGADGSLRTVTGSADVSRILDDQFLLWHSTSDTGDDEYLSLTGFDQHIGTYRNWGFDSHGAVHERVSGRAPEAVRDARGLTANGSPVN